MSEPMDPSTKDNPVRTAVSFGAVAFAAFIALWLILYLAQPTVSVTHSIPPKKACNMNCIVYTNAVEMFNMENPNNPITRFDPITQETRLVDDGFLRGPLLLPNPACRYSGTVDEQGWIISCSFHGTNSRDFYKPRENFLYKLLRGLRLEGIAFTVGIARYPPEECR